MRYSLWAAPSFVGLWTGRRWGTVGALVLEAIWVATFLLLYPFTADPATAIVLLTVPPVTVVVLLAASRLRAGTRR